jgi:hypothetical protein
MKDAEYAVHEAAVNIPADVIASLETAEKLSDEDRTIVTADFINIDPALNQRVTCRVPIPIRLRPYLGLPICRVPLFTLKATASCAIP